MSFILMLRSRVFVPMSEDSLGLSPAVGYDLALSSLGACVWTLKRSLIDHDLLQLGQFQVIMIISNIYNNPPICFIAKNYSLDHSKFRRVVQKFFEFFIVQTGIYLYGFMYMYMLGVCTCR